MISQGHARSPGPSMREGDEAPVRWRIVLAVLLILWLVGVLLVGLALNACRIEQGATVLIVDRSRGWGLHRMDVAVIAIATLPVLVTALVATLARLVSPRPPDRQLH